MKTTSDNYASARNRILGRVRRNLPPRTALPAVPKYAVSGDVEENFMEHVVQFDGGVVRFGSRHEAVEWLRNNVGVDGRERVLSLLPDFAGNTTMADLPMAGDADTLSACVAEARLGVGETGSVLVTPETFGRAINGLLALNLYILLDRRNLVDGIQTSYAMTDLASTQYSSFFSGPSATADIEAVHITGAQGPLSLTVLLY
ncbi:MAG: hypothetical protein NC336_08840 [Clostridium sp.]|nr:hypothetical protein [Clostridium sp.]